jgi:hypothetical protein
MKQAKHKVTEELQMKTDTNTEPLEYNAEFEREILERLLKMADDYNAANSIHQATEIYIELAEVHGATPEARLAKQRLAAIGSEYEEQGQMHLAIFMSAY